MYVCTNVCVYLYICHGLNDISHLFWDISVTMLLLFTVIALL